MKQNMRFQVGIYPEKFQLDPRQNGQTSAKSNFNMPDIWHIKVSGGDMPLKIS